MNSKRKILVTDYASLIEKRENYPDCESTQSISEADVLVNPKWGIFMDKEIVYNLPISSPITDLDTMGNKIVSRFMIGGSVEVVPFKETEPKEVGPDKFSLKILNGDLMLDPEFAREIDESNYLIGITPEIDGQPTLVGKKLMESKVREVEIEG